MVWIQSVARTSRSARRNLSKGHVSSKERQPPHTVLSPRPAPDSPCSSLLAGFCESALGPPALSLKKQSMFVYQLWPQRWWVWPQKSFRISGFLKIPYNSEALEIGASVLEREGGNASVNIPQQVWLFMLGRLGQANNEPVKSTLCNWSHDAVHEDFLVEMKKNKHVYSDRTLMLGF